MSVLSLRRQFLTHWRNIHGHVNRMLAAAKDHALQWAHVFVIPTPGQQDVVIAGGMAVRRVEIDPARIATEDAHPCMRRIGPDEPGAARRWHRRQVAAHVPSREPKRTEAGKLQVSE